MLDPPPGNEGTETRVSVSSFPVGGDRALLRHDSHCSVSAESRADDRNLIKPKLIPMP